MSEGQGAFDLGPASAREILERDWLDLTRILLPDAARPDWPIHNDHCFQRVLLDAACGGVWYDHITARPAYRHAPDAVLGQAVDLGREVLAGTADLSALNTQSLHWRAKHS